MDWVDTKLKAEIGRINVNVDTSFVVNILVSKGGLCPPKGGGMVKDYEGSYIL